MVSSVVGKDFQGDGLEEVATLVDFADVLVAQPGAVMNGRLLLAVAGAPGPVAGRRVWRDDGVKSARREVGDVTNLSRRCLDKPFDDVEVLLAKEEKAVHSFQPLDAGAAEQMAHFFYSLLADAPSSANLAAVVVAG